MKTVDARIILTGFALLAVGILLSAALAIWTQHSAQRDFDGLHRQVTDLSDQLEMLAMRLSGRDPVDPRNLREPLAQNDLQQRLQAIEEDLALLWQAARTPSVPLAEESSQGHEDEDTAARKVAARPIPKRILANRFQSEGTVSSWGKSSEEGVSRAFEASSYFGVTGGEINAECRSSACRLVWYLPDLDAMNAQERELLLMLGKSELAALAAQGATQVGQLESEWILDDGAPRLSLFFTHSN